MGSERLERVERVVPDSDPEDEGDDEDEDEAMEGAISVEDEISETLRTGRVVSVERLRVMANKASFTSCAALAATLWNCQNFLPCASWWKGKDRPQRTALIQMSQDILVTMNPVLVHRLIEGDLPAYMRRPDRDEGINRMITEVDDGQHPGIYAFYIVNEDTGSRSQSGACSS